MSKKEHLTAEMIADWVVKFRNVDNDDEMGLRILRNVVQLVFQERKAGQLVDKEYKSADFWYGRINKHPEDATREDVWRIMQAYADQRGDQESNQNINTVMVDVKDCHNCRFHYIDHLSCACIEYTNEKCKWERRVTGTAAVYVAVNEIRDKIFREELERRMPSVDELAKWNFRDVGVIHARILSELLKSEKKS